MNIHRSLCALFSVTLLALVLSGATGTAWSQVPPATAQVAEEPPIPDSQIPAYIKNAINAPNRPAADKALDAGRKPAQLMAFFDIKPGMKVADLFAAGGWMTEVLSRVVGPTGTVYSQNGKFPLRFIRIEKAWQARLKRPDLKNVVPVSKPFAADNFLGVPPGSLDAVVINLNYHDLVLAKVNTEKMDRSVFTALKSGGVYGIVDHAAKSGTGTSAASLHRIDEQYVIGQVEQAGFKLAAASSALRNPNDPRTESSRTFPRGHTDRFVLKFVKP